MNNLEELLGNTDFSQDNIKKEAIKTRLKSRLPEIQKKKQQWSIAARHGRIAAVIAACVLIAACSVFYGEEIIKAVSIQFNVGRYASFVVNDSVNTGKGLAVEFPGDILSYDAEIEKEKGMVTYFGTIDEVKPYLAFNPLMPNSLPGGFAIDRISLYNDKNGQPLALGSNMYLNVYYTNAEKTQQIYMQIRLMDEETGFTASASHDMRYISINGHTGVIDYKNTVNVEIDGVMYMITTRAEDVTQADVVRMAESLK